MNTGSFINLVIFFLPGLILVPACAYNKSLLLRVADMSLTYISHKKGPKMNIRGTP
jgi:hypothetical protein